MLNHSDRIEQVLSLTSFQPLNPSELMQAVGRHSDSVEGTSENDSDDDDDDSLDHLSAESGSEGDIEQGRVIKSNSLSSLEQSQSSLTVDSVPLEDQVEETFILN